MSVLRALAGWWNPYRKIPSVREAIRIQPGDYVAIHLEEPMDAEAGQRLLEMLKEVWPDVKCVLFEPGLDVKVLRAPAQPAPKKPSPGVVDGWGP